MLMGQRCFPKVAFPDRAAPITMAGAQPEAIRFDKVICAVALSKTEGEAFSIVHLTARGAVAWRLLRA